jgi:hypothetical protein
VVVLQPIVDPWPANLQTSSKADTPYRYVRSDVNWPLVNKNKDWTEAEARMIAIALNQLPLSYLRKAENGGLNRLERHGAHPEVVGITADEACAISPPLLGYMGFANDTFESQEKANRIVCHELAHQVEWGMGAFWYVKGSDFTDIAWEPSFSIPWYGKKNWNSFVNSYARKDPWEDFAIACEWYWYSPDALRAHSSSKYDYVKSHVFNHQVSPEAIRTNKDGADFIKPGIDSVGDGSADKWDTVKVRGDYFLDMFEGGYTKVYFRDERAWSTTVSSHTSYATVPWMDEGNATVKVKTPDGWSNGKTFKIEKPWWEFW